MGGDELLSPATEAFPLLLSKIRQWYAVFALMCVGLLSDEDTC